MTFCELLVLVIVGILEWWILKYVHEILQFVLEAIGVPMAKRELEKNETKNTNEPYKKSDNPNKTIGFSSTTTTNEKKSG